MMFKSVCLNSKALAHLKESLLHSAFIATCSEINKIPPHVGGKLGLQVTTGQSGVANNSLGFETMTLSNAKISSEFISFLRLMLNGDFPIFWLAV